jgi:DNA-binding NarL/FixJ family response regulator
MTENVRLSRREIEVMELLLEGKSNKQIAESFDISVRTVEFHLKNIYSKFQVTRVTPFQWTLGDLRDEGYERIGLRTDWVKDSQ